MMEAFHLQGSTSRLFCVAWRPPVGQRIQFGVLCLLPFAEEANKSRRMVAEQARAFAQLGGLVLVADFSGTGDSEGDFADARLEHWIGDVESAWNWLNKQASCPLWLWGIRLGGLLAARQAGQLTPQPRGIVLWQPVVSGKTFMQQFLRLAQARQLGSGETGRTDIKTALESGAPIEVGGYELHLALSQGIQNLKLDNHAPACKSVLWLECGSSDDSSLSPGSQRCVEKWRQAGAAVRTEILVCSSFWATQEIEQSEALVARTTALVREAMADD